MKKTAKKAAVKKTAKKAVVKKKAKKAATGRTPSKARVVVGGECAAHGGACALALADRFHAVGHERHAVVVQPGAAVQLLAGPERDLAQMPRARQARTPPDVLDVPRGERTPRVVAQRVEREHLPVVVYEGHVSRGAVRVQELHVHAVAVAAELVLGGDANERPLAARRDRVRRGALNAPRAERCAGRSGDAARGTRDLFSVRERFPLLGLWRIRGLAECQNTSKLSREIVTRWYHNARRRMGR